uniref:Uncharacterized protein LOC113786241 n=1 Tax=Cicer arietinum TaxID=3827 RepID=A0A3Q7XYJ9_CICAR|nr:uncharacterized protein LOC113786241 [Cicer arietinum]
MRRKRKKERGNQHRRRNRWWWLRNRNDGRGGFEAETMNVVTVVSKQKWRWLRLRSSNDGGGGFETGGCLLQNDLIGTKCGDKTTPIAASKKLKVVFLSLNFQENVGISSIETGDISNHATLEDYNPIDLSPGAAKNVKAGPIEHETPLMPFLPKPPPPSPLNSGPGDYN